jgi:hypothetical protein
MGSTSKVSTLILTTLLVAASFLLVPLANAQTIPKPSVPEFNVNYVDRSYDTQPTYGYDQYTGKNVITKQSQHVDNRTIEIKIKNQPFTPFTDQNGNNINLLYNVRYKGSFGQEWSSMFGERSEWANSGTIDPYGTYGYPTQDSSSQYTTISFSLYWNMVEGQLDIQVEALVGYTNRTVDPAREHILWSVYLYNFSGEESGWSNTQTVTIGETSISPNPTTPTTSTPTNNLTSTLAPIAPDTNSDSTNLITLPLEVFVIIVAVVVLLAVALSVLLFVKHRKTTNLKN